MSRCTRGIPASDAITIPYTVPYEHGPCHARFGRANVGFPRGRVLPHGVRDLRGKGPQNPGVGITGGCFGAKLVDFGQSTRVVDIREAKEGDEIARRIVKRGVVHHERRDPYFPRKLCVVRDRLSVCVNDRSYDPHRLFVSERREETAEPIGRLLRNAAYQRRAVFAKQFGTHDGGSTRRREGREREPSGEV